jgi:hypothetical protein
VGVLVKWLAVATLLLAATAGCGNERDGAGRDLVCPGVTASGVLDYVEGVPGARTAASAAEPFLDPADRLVEDADNGPETITFRRYDTDDDLLGLVRVVRSHGQWHADRVDTCE